MIVHTVRINICKTILIIRIDANLPIPRFRDISVHSSKLFIYLPNQVEAIITFCGAPGILDYPAAPDVVISYNKDSVFAAVGGFTIVLVDALCWSPAVKVPVHFKTCRDGANLIEPPFLLGYCNQGLVRWHTQSST